MPGVIKTKQTLFKITNLKVCFISVKMMFIDNHFEVFQVQFDL